MVKTNEQARGEDQFLPGLRSRSATVRPSRPAPVQADLFGLQGDPLDRLAQLGNECRRHLWMGQTRKAAFISLSAFRMVLGSASKSPLSNTGLLSQNETNETEANP